MIEVLSQNLMQPAPKVFIVLLNWNGWQDTIECLESLFRLDYPNYHVVVCDNASTDHSLEHIQAWADGQQPAPCTNPQLAHLTLPAVAKPISYQWITDADAEAKVDKPRAELSALTLIQTGANLGFAAGNNIGLRYAVNQGCDFVWLLNNDTVVRPDAISHLVTRCAEEQAKCICGSTLFYYHSPNTVQVLAGARYNPATSVSYPVGENLSLSLEELKQFTDTDKIERQLECLIGAAMFVPVSLLEDVGLLSEDYFLYCEENDWSERSQQAGYRLKYEPKSVVYHKLGSSTKSTAGTAARSFMSDYYQTRSRLIFTKKFYASYLPWVRLTLLMGGIKRLLRGKPKHAFMQWKLAITPEKHSQ